MTAENHIKLVIEALLFTSDTPLSVQDMHVCLPNVPVADIKKEVSALQEEYDHMGRSIAIKEVAKGYQFRTLSKYAPYILRMLKTSPTRLSQAAMETLAIIAYKQPILRQEIERLRGVDAGGILRTLMEKDLIRIVGRRNLPGRPLIYGSTRRFLEIFELKNIQSLPKLKEINEMGSEAQGTPMSLTEVLSDEESAKDLPDEESNESQDPEEPE